MPARVVTFLKTLWRNLPFRPALLLMLALFLIEEEFPFSNFPMYANYGNEANVLFLASQDSEPLAMRDVLRTGTATAKKMYKSELTKITKKQDRSLEEATLEERQAAGAKLLERLLPRLKSNNVDPATTELRIYIRTFSLDKKGKLIRTEPEHLATHPL